MKQRRVSRNCDASFFSLEIYKLHISEEENLLVEDANINGCVEDPLKWFEILVP